MPGEPAERLPLTDWMSASATRAVIAALEAQGGEGCARFVGGCVRNLILDKAIDDIDIATQLEPEQTMAALTSAGIRFVPTGVEHGTVTAIVDGRPFEVTSLRRDVATDGRRAVVAFTRDWSEDAERREFRLNALYLDARGGLYDPVGRGVEDARAGRIVFVGEPAQRIREDYLRILRFFRFQAWYGRQTPDADGLAACAALKSGLAQLSAERVSKELLKLLAAPDPREALRLMDGAGVLGEVLSGHIGLRRIGNLIAIERAAGRPADPELRLAALLPGDSKAAAARADRLRLSKAQRGRLSAAACGEAPDEGRARQLTYRIGAQAYSDRVILGWADATDAVPAEAWRRLSEQTAWTPPRFPLNGDDAVAAGFTPGPAMGAALRAAEDWWVDQDFKPDRAALLARLKS